MKVGELYWLSPERPTDVSHPQVVVEIVDAGSVRVCGLSSNLERAKAPGNVLLAPGEGGLERQSVIVASQLSLVAADRLQRRIGALTAERMHELERGIAFVHVLTSR